VRDAGVVEVPLGTRLREVVERCGGMRDGKELLAFLPGGASTAFLPADRADVALEWESLAAAGSALGAGAIVIVGAGADLLDLAGNLTAFFREESCGKCVPCRIGTEKAVVLIERREEKGLGLLPQLNEALLETSLCGLGQVALTPVLSVLEHFPIGNGGSRR
jgi:NADH:ubiquinone oxidoreductase subunit F (NADH-binding)